MVAQLLGQAARSGKAAWLANCLRLAASPCFALMAVVSAGDADPICSAGRGAFHLGGMGAMYWMMCAFHLPAWLNRSGNTSRRSS